MDVPLRVYTCSDKSRSYNSTRINHASVVKWSEARLNGLQQQTKVLIHRCPYERRQTKVIASSKRWILAPFNLSGNDLYPFAQIYNSCPSTLTITYHFLIQTKDQNYNGQSLLILPLIHNGKRVVLIKTVFCGLHTRCSFGGEYMVV